MAQIPLSDRTPQATDQAQDGSGSDRGRHIGGPMKVLDGMRVLVAEDEYLLADEMTECFQHAGAKVLGPTPTVEQTLLKLSDATALDAAVLDINLRGVLVFPVADELARRGIPFVFFTGYDDIMIPARFRSARRVLKPADLSELVGALVACRPGAERPVPRVPARRLRQRPGRWDVAAILPKLRRAALLRMGNRAAADRLVQHTLERAIAEMHSFPPSGSLEDWLDELLQGTLHEDRDETLH